MTDVPSEKSVSAERDSVVGRGCADKVAVQSKDTSPRPLQPSGRPIISFAPRLTSDSQPGKVTKTPARNLPVPNTVTPIVESTGTITGPPVAANPTQVETPPAAGRLTMNPSVDIPTGSEPGKFEMDQDLTWLLPPPNPSRSKSVTPTTAGHCTTEPPQMEAPSTKRFAMKQEATSTRLSTTPLTQESAATGRFSMNPHHVETPSYDRFVMILPPVMVTTSTESSAMKAEAVPTGCSTMPHAATPTGRSAMNPPQVEIPPNGHIAMNTYRVETSSTERVAMKPKEARTGPLIAPPTEATTETGRFAMNSHQVETPSNGHFATTPTPATTSWRDAATPTNTIPFQPYAAYPILAGLFDSHLVQMYNLLSRDEMNELMDTYGPEYFAKRNRRKNSDKEELTSLLRSRFRQWNPGFFEWFIYDGGTKRWIPRLGEHYEKARRKVLRKGPP